MPWTFVEIVNTGSTNDIYFGRVRFAYNDHEICQTFYFYGETPPTTEQRQAVINAFLNQLNQQLKDSEVQQVIQFCATGGRIQDFPFVELTLQQCARRILKYLVVARNPREAEPFARQCIAAGQTQVRNILGVTDAVAGTVMDWAANIVQVANTHDTSKSQVNEEAMVE